MQKFQGPGVKTLPFQTFIRSSGAIKAVSKQRMTDGGEVNTNLMCSARLKTAPEVRITMIAIQDGPVGLGGTGIFIRDSHFQPIFRISADRLIDRPSVIPDETAGDCFILPGQRPVCQLGG